MRYNTTKRDPIKNSFIMHNEIFRLGLSEGAIAVYAYLLYCEDRETYQCYPSYTTIADAVNKSENSVRKYVAELVVKRLIETEHTTVTLKDDRKHNGSLKYNTPVDYRLRVSSRKKKYRKILRRWTFSRKSCPGWKKHWTLQKASYTPLP
ncbi:MAG: helix-turn-helix domain-containing protein [Clostridia bacterium]|nr:helix-turn-helix domain-containing protein [Clostridia bacterium]